MTEDNKTTVNVKVESSDFWWAFSLLALIVLCYGTPDLLDVLAEWCRRYMEIAA